MKKLILLLSVLFMSILSYSQSFTGAVEFQSKLQPAAVVELPYPHSVVEAAMNDYLSKTGKSKVNDVKGFILYRNTDPVPADSINADLYFKTERKSRKEKEVTVISLLVTPVDAQSTGNIHYLTMETAREYLNNLAAAIDDYHLKLTIKDQNGSVIKAEEKYKSLQSEGKDLEAKRLALEKKIADNKNDQEQQLKEIENQKQRLMQWVNLRKS